MQNHSTTNILNRKATKLWHVAYWLMATALMFLVFSNSHYDLQIRVVLVTILTIASYFTATAVNKHLIPQFLFKGRTLTFAYLLFFLFIFTFWLNLFLILIIMLYSFKYLPNETVIPKNTDVLILITGNYLIVILAAVIYFIKTSFNHGLESERLASQKLTLTSHLKMAQSRLLQGQIHPHFIFNMLNNLFGLVKKDSDKAREIIIRMSDLLEYMLYKCNNEMVLLSDEINFIKNYIELERVRHDDGFKISAVFPHDLKDEKIPPLILFPFIENAFKHGTANTGSEGIKIDLTLSDKSINFKVENTISTVPSSSLLKKESNGIGLKNVQERLRLSYPDKNQLHIHSDKTCFKIHLVIVKDNG
jgi:two-component system, LytTR family, sensor kinase